MGAGQSRDINESAVEPGLDEILQDSPEWASASAAFFRSVKRDTFKIKKLWKVRRTSLFAQYEKQSTTLGKPTQLFHGTSLSSAKNIARSGFKLPSYAGLYGKGIYFASDPNKSAHHAPEATWAPFFRRWGAHGFLKALTSKDEGQMLVCDVYLGRSKTVCFSTWSDIEPSKDLQGGWLSQQLGMKAYDSIHAPGLISHTEYIVYKESQAIPRYLIEFEYVRTRIV